MKLKHLLGLSVISFLGVLLLSISFASPSHAHWADLSVAEIIVDKTETQVTLTFPTGLIASADDNRDGELSRVEVQAHQAELQNFLGDRLRLSDGKGHRGALNLKALETAALPPSLKTTAGTHSTLLLTYTWPQPVQGLTIYYNLFLPGVPTASSLATIVQNGQLQNFVFTPKNRQFSLTQGPAWLANTSLLVAIMGAFGWGAMHTLSPGHGKTVVGAYLVGAHATPKHALFLGLTTTIAHTAGVFALGLVTLFASNFIVPQLYPWLSFLSGLMVVSIGLNLFIRRVGTTQKLRKSLTGHDRPNHPSNQGHSHRHPHDAHNHSPTHHGHDHSHPGHSHGNHSHLPLGTDGPVTWRGLLALGISGGILPCPSAMVVLLSAISLGRIGFGLVLVLAFSLGLAGVLTGLGLLLIYAKQLFERMPTNNWLIKVSPVMKVLPTVSALFIALIGLAIMTQALIQIGLVRL